MDDPQKILLRVTLVSIVLLTLFAVFGAPRMGADIDPGYEMGAILFGVLLAVGLADVIAARFLVLPRVVAAAEATKDQAAALGSAFAVAPAVYGLVISLFTDQGLLALPFGALALWGLALVWIYLREALPQ